MEIEGLIEALSAGKMVRELNAGLEVCARLIEKTAKDEIGHYQPETEPFPAWAPLADSTVREKTRLGYVGRLSADDPLYRTGEMRDSIEHRTGELETEIGTDSTIAPYHEFGTEKMPPRPFLGPALVRNKENIEKIVGAFGVVALTPPSVGQEWKNDVERIVNDAGV